MSIGARLNGRITQLAVGRHLPHRTVRVRLTLLYGGLFLASGAALMAISYALLVNAGFVFTLQGGSGAEAVTSQPASVALRTPPGVPRAGAPTNPSAQTMAHWRQVASCMRQHGVSGFPSPANSYPSNVFSGKYAMIADRDGAILAIPATVKTDSAAFTQATSTCGFMADRTRATAQANHRRTQVRKELLIQSAIALAGMSLLSLGLGWLMAGRVLQPLEDSYRAQRQFVANASHELRAPLTRLRALSEVALASPEANLASLRRAHERVLASEHHLEQLIDGLLALTRGQAGLEHRERLDLAALTSEAVLARELQFSGRDLGVHTTLDPAPTDGDPRLLERLITNLIDNAIRHNTPGGHIEITTGTRDRHAFVSISNTGPTIPPEQIQRLFQPFQRLDGARTRHNHGHGLGLSIVQAIANAHHAELSARSRAEGGLSIVISFPPTGAGSGVTLAGARTKLVRRAVSARE
ncbi:MAG TPA: HAMP domain-containing sensor histidine kinase [Solirubrobacteraceae bacterium]|nr:HAMP domain-containing sensor histidine kinase [Solirubrobacteraceae bacterium]